MDATSVTNRRTDRDNKKLCYRRQAARREVTILPHNSVGTTYTTNPENIEVLELEGYSRYDTRCYFNVRSKADMSQLNLPHGNDN